MSLSRRDFSCPLAAGGLALNGCAGLPAAELSLNALAKPPRAMPAR